MRKNAKVIARIAVSLYALLLISSCAEKAADERFSTPAKTYSLWLESSLKVDMVVLAECITVASGKFMDIQVQNRDVFIERMTNAVNIFKNYSVVDEKIEGNRAIVLIQESKTGNSIAVPFLYEEGWKVNLIAMFSGG